MELVRLIRCLRQFRKVASVTTRRVALLLNEGKITTWNVD
jgi:hypothetical protein